jgi:CBS domain-containing membrane protein
MTRGINHWLPDPAGRGWRYIAITVISACLCLLAVIVVNARLNPQTFTPYIVASMGAAAVLMFAAPGAPMAKSWAFATGNVVSALIGVSCVKWFGPALWCGPVAVALAIFAMHLLRCQHPPGGATALFAVIGGPTVHALGYGYVLNPVAINVGVFLVFVTLHRQLLQRLALRKQLQSQLLGSLTFKQVGKDDGGLIAGDIDYALQNLGTYLDVSREQLLNIFQLAQHNAQRRKMGVSHCGALLSPLDNTIAYGDSLLDALNKMTRLQLDFLTVTKAGKQVEGIITLADIAARVDAEPAATLNQRLVAAITPSGNLHSEQEEVVGQLMSSVTIAHEHDCLLDVLKQSIAPLRFIAVVDASGLYLGAIDAHAL